MRTIGSDKHRYRTRYKPTQLQIKQDLLLNKRTMGANKRWRDDQDRKRMQLLFLRVLCEDAHEIEQFAALALSRISG